MKLVTKLLAVITLSVTSTLSFAQEAKIIEGIKQDYKAYREAYEKKEAQSKNSSLPKQKLRLFEQETIEALDVLENTCLNYCAPSNCSNKNVAKACTSYCGYEPACLESQGVKKGQKAYSDHLKSLGINLDSNSIPMTIIKEEAATPKTEVTASTGTEDKNSNSCAYANKPVEIIVKVVTETQPQSNNNPSVAQSAVSNSNSNSNTNRISPKETIQASEPSTSFRNRKTVPSKLIEPEIFEEDIEREVKPSIQSHSSMNRNITQNPAPQAAASGPSQACISAADENGISVADAIAQGYC